MADEYIKRSDALAVIERFNGYLDDDMQYRIKFMLNRDCPPADVVEVVRCKDCKHCTPFYWDKGLCHLWAENGIDVFLDGFCNYGTKMAEYKTNADRVRNMTDEEINEWFWWMLKYSRGYTDSRMAVLEWLKAEGKDDV